MKLKRLCAALLGALLCLPAVLHADDTDIYINPNTPDAAMPLVMFSIDYRSNLTSTVCSNVNTGCPAADFFRTNGLGGSLPVAGKLVFFDVLRLSLQLVLSEVKDVKIGLMLNHNNNNNRAGPNANDTVSGSRTGGSNGGYIAMGFRELREGDGNGTLAAMVDIMASMKQRQDAIPNAQHPYQGKELFFEFYRYLTGGGIFNSHNGYTDYSNADARRNLNVQFPRMDWDAGIETLGSTTGCGGPNQPPCKGVYRSPLTGADQCTKIFTINFLFQVSQVEDDSDNAITSGAGSMTGINLAGNSNKFSTVIEYMFDRDLAPSVDGVQNVTSYFIVDPNQINTTTNGYAQAGGTSKALAMAEDPEALVETLRNIFKQILSVSTTFVAASVPVNVFNRAQVIDNVYIALFQADANGRPFWPGNLKKLKLKESTLADGSTDLSLVDSLGANAVAADGRIQFDALTFWTDSSALPDADVDSQISAGRDGRHVSRGGAGQKIPGFLSNAPKLTNAEAGARKMFYDGAGGLAPLNADTTTAAALRTSLGAASNDEALNLLKWIRGQDVNNERRTSETDTSTTDARLWMMGDALHSRPLPINYGTAGGYSTSNPAIFIAMATNDGFMHFFRNTTTGGAESGEEVWAFMPRKAMGIQKKLFNNTPVSPLHPYGVDGAAAAFQDGTRTYLFFGMRRGGDAYYALDVTDPLNPALLWSIDSTSPGFSELGLTFSTPKIGYVNAGGARAAVIFGGGYDTHKDYLTPNSPDSKGRGIFVVDAQTGALIWKATAGASTGGSGSSYTHAELQDSIPSDVTIGDTDGDGYIDRVVVGDTGGNVWRADLGGSGPSDWKLTLLAKLGYHAETGKASDRRFFHAPDLVQSTDFVTGATATCLAGQNCAFDGVLIGAGDREDPTDRSGTALNYFYLIKDRNTGVGGGVDSTLEHADLTDITTNTCLTRQTAQQCNVNIDLGWKLALVDGVGEKALSSPVTFAGTVFFTTYLPNAGSEDRTCGPAEGGGVLYAIKLLTGAAAYNFDRSDDVGGDTSGLANSAADRTDPLASGGIPAQVVFIPAGNSGLSYIRPDLDPRDPGVRRSFTSFWQRVED